MNNPYAAKALELIQRGYTVIPLNGKVPLIEKWQNLRVVTSEMVYDWERSGLWRNIGLVTGTASDNTVVIDFDGLAGFELFKVAFPDLQNTMMVATGSGNGMHCYYRVDLLPQSSALLNIPIEGGELVNIEFKSDGKQVVIPPSIHPDTLKEYTVFNRAPIMRVSDLAAVWAWVKSLRPDVQEWQPPTVSQRSDELNTKLLVAVERHFTAQPHKMNHEWINCSCPNTANHKHGDKDYSFGYNPQGFGNCYVCGEMNLKTLLPLIGMSASDFGGFYEQSEPTAPRMMLAAPPLPPAITPAPIQPSNAIPVIKRSKRLTNYIDRLFDYDRPIAAPPVVFPLKCLHHLGGMARVIKPGKLVGIVGISGGGKTSLLETIVDGLLSVHAESLVWSPEWSADEFIERAVQRYGGPTSSEVYLHEIYIDELQRGIKNGVGQELNEAKLNSAKESIKILRGWTDEVGYLDMPFLTMGYLQNSIDSTLKEIDFKPRALIIDYIQLFHALETDHDITMYNMIMRIKAVCQTYGLVGIIASQVTKSDAKGQNGGQFLDAMSARYVNDDAFNLFITINPDYEEDGNKQASAVLNVVKNSMGKPGKVRVAVDWPKLTFSDKAHPNQMFKEGF